MDEPHIAVMAGEVLQWLAPRQGGVYIDCTVGAGGHSRRLAAELQRLGPGSRLIGFDKDPSALDLARPGLAATGIDFELIPADFAQAAAELRTRGIERVQGAIADLGVSSMQLDRPERGFSFVADGPLDMRMDPRQELTAEQVVNQMGERELADLLFQFADERRSRRISRAIVRSRPFHTTAQLAGLVAAVNRTVKPSGGRKGIHPATRTFQALRIFVNSEIASLTNWLEQLPGMLAPGGRAVTLSFHSLEDRPIKQSFREGARQGWYKLLTPHTVRPGEEETRTNPRARSAKLRAVERLS